MELMISPFAYVRKRLGSGHGRSVRAKKNILAAFFIKGAGICISLILVPLTINYVNASQYGIWLTLSSIVGWFSFFDIGLGQGLRNKFAEAIAKCKDDLAQTYVSTTYAILFLIFSIIWIIFLMCNQFLNWGHILKIPQSMQTEVSELAVIVFTYFCFQFVLRIITTILIANQQPAKSSLIDLCGQAVSLLLIFILVKTTNGSLIKLGIALCISPILVLLTANVFLFNGSYKRYRPALSKVRFSYAKGLFNLGLVFFIIQVAGIIQFETANIIIARNFGTSEVTSYNIVYKYFGMLTMVFTIFLTPFWSASTEAYLKKDFHWIKNGIKKYNILNIVLLGVAVLMLLFSKDVYILWLGKGIVNIPFALSLWGFVFFNASIFGSKYVFFLNGISALRIQFFASLISPFLYVAVALILINYYGMGVYALFIASVIANFNGVIIAPIQYHYVINRNNKGIWAK